MDQTDGCGLHRQDSRQFGEPREAVRRLEEEMRDCKALRVDQTGQESRDVGSTPGSLESQENLARRLEDEMKDFEAPRVDQTGRESKDVGCPGRSPGSLESQEIRCEEAGRRDKGL